jgi:hypothetical protein
MHILTKQLGAALGLTPSLVLPAEPFGSTEGIALQAVYTDLVRSLTQGEFGAVELLERHSGQLAHAMGTDFDRLVRAVEAFDFDNALLILGSLVFRDQTTVKATHE